MKRFIVTADDFGLTRGINAGIIEAHTRGVVTAAAIVPVGLAFEDAIEHARRHPALDIGVHLVLDEEPCPERGYRTLLDEHGHFLPRHRLVARLMRGAIDRGEVYACWRSQIARAFDAGLRPSFLNSHGHVHVWPSLFPIVRRLAREFRIVAVRRPVELAWPTNGVSRWIKDASITSAALLSMRTLDGLQTTDNFRGLARSGHLTALDVTRYFAGAVSGVTELMSHPGSDDEDTRTRYRSWGYDWDGERRALIAADRGGIALTTFAAEFTPGGST